MSYKAFLVAQPRNVPDKVDHGNMSAITDAGAVVVIPNMTLERHDAAGRAIRLVGG